MKRKSIAARRSMFIAMMLRSGKNAHFFVVKIIFGKTLLNGKQGKYYIQKTMLTSYLMKISTTPDRIVKIKGAFN